MSSQKSFSTKNLKITVQNIIKPVKLENETRFVNDFVNAGYSLDEAKNLANRDIADTINYMKTYHNITIEP